MIIIITNVGIPSKLFLTLLCGVLYRVLPLPVNHDLSLDRDDLDRTKLHGVEPHHCDRGLRCHGAGWLLLVLYHPGLGWGAGHLG